MKKCYLDSNVLIYFKDSSSSHHRQSVDKLMSLLQKDFALFISVLVLDEFLYVFRYGLLKKKIKDPFIKLKDSIEEILELPNLTMLAAPIETSAQIKVVSFMEKYDLNPRDAYHLLTMSENKIDYFATFDNDFNQVFKSKILKLF